jgi:signal transduction histidine kinase
MMETMNVRRLRPAEVDWLVCLAAALVTAHGTSDKVAGWFPHGWILPLAAVQGLALLWRRRVPLAVLAATTALGAFMVIVGYPDGTASFGPGCAAYALAMYGSEAASSDRAASRAEAAERAEVWRGVVATLASAVVIILATLAPAARDRPGLWGGLPVASAWVLGYAIRTRRAYIGELKERAARLEAQEGERAAQAVADERLRIARELHDVIGHSISLITIQSEAAARSARTNPAAVPGFLATISATSRSALSEMRHVLAVLRPEAQADMSPQPGLDTLPELVARLEDGGLSTRLDVEPIDLPPGIGLAVFRIVQESLTNVLKHAGADACASVTIARVEGSVRVSVHDDGVGQSKPISSAAHGIVGMRERAALYGGTLSTGTRSAGGFEVEARIPLPEEDA